MNSVVGKCIRKRLRLPRYLRKIEDKTTIVFLTSHVENALEEVAES